MAKKVDKKKKISTTTLSEKSDKSKKDVRERQAGKYRLREEQSLQAQKNNELKILEHQLREERLKPTCAMLSELSRKKYEHDRTYRDELDWKHRTRCDGTPNPQVVQELNTYLFVCKQACRRVYDERNTYADKCLEIFDIMNAVDDVVDLPLYSDQFKLQCFREVSDELGRLLVDIVYGACYHLLSDYDRRMNPLDLETAAYRNACEAFTVGLYAVCHRPRLRTDDRPPPKCDFPECLVTVEVPPQLSQQHMAVMALWLHWDPFTGRISEFDVSESPELDTRDLWQYSADVWDERNQVLRTLNEERERWTAKTEEKLKAFGGGVATVEYRSQYPEDSKTYEPRGDEDAATIKTNDYASEEEQEEPEAEQQDEIEIRDEKRDEIQSIHIEFKQNPSEEMERRQVERAEEISNSLKYPEKPNELNPRRYWIIGGAFNVEMWKLPMQPIKYQDGSVGVLLFGPAALQPIDYYEKYEPLQLSMGFSSTSSEDEETDVKKQNQEALKRLTLISIKLPENVLWFENPKPAVWNEEKKVWTTDYIYDIRFNEEKQTVSFRAGRMGSFGLAVNRYSNFPFQSWEVRPEGGTTGGTILSVTAATVLVEFLVRDDHAAMVQLQNATTVALQEMVGVFYRPDKLVRLLRRGGVNLFPEPDARHYVDGRRPPKHALTERHLYRCMAALSGTHQFAASRWNVQVSADRIVFQMKETPDGENDSSSSGASVVPYKMVMVTPERAVLLKCNEVSQAFSEEPQSAAAQFAPDLFALAADVASTDRVRTALTRIDDFKTVQTLFYLLDKIKLLSYS